MRNVIKKRRKSFFDQIFEEDFFKDLLEFPDISSDVVGTSYSIQVSQTGDKTIVRARVSGDVEVEKFRRELEERYPGAEIIIEGGRPLIEEIGSGDKSTNLRSGKVIQSNVSGKKQKDSLIEEIRDKDG